MTITNWIKRLKFCFRFGNTYSSKAFYKVGVPEVADLFLKCLNIYFQYTLYFDYVTTDLKNYVSKNIASLFRKNYFPQLEI